MKLLSIAFLGIATSAHAQFDMVSGMMDMQYHPPAVLMRPEIRKELKLSKEQAKQLDEIQKEMANSARSGNPTSFDVAGMFAQQDAKVLAVLDDTQKDRLQEIRVQIMGAVSLSDPQVAKGLNLTDDQKATVKKTRADTFKQYMSAIQSGKRSGLDKLMEQLSKDQEKVLIALLDDDQKTALTKMAGTPFKNARQKGQWPI